MNSRKLRSRRDEVIKYYKSYLNEGEIARGDYKELAEGMLYVLGSTPSDGKNKWYKPAGKNILQSIHIVKILYCIIFLCYL